MDRQEHRHHRSVLARPRLLSRLDGADGRVVVLRAEGGAGKTTLASSWAEHLDDDLVWVSLDEATRGRSSFWHRMLLTLRAAQVLPDTISLEQHLEDYLAPDLVPGLLADQLRRRRRLVLVVDDLHHADTGAVDDLVWVAERVPSLFLVVTTRVRTALEDPITVARLGVTVIGSTELAVTTDEIGLLATSPDWHPTAAEKALVASITHGNALAVRLALAALREVDERGEAREAVVERLTHVAARDLMPVFARDADRRAAQLWALSPGVDAVLAQALSGGERTAESLARFEGDGLGTVTLRGGRAVFRFHALIESALAREAAAELSAAALRAARRVAAAHHAEWGDPIDVVRLLLEAQDDDALWRFFAQRFSELSVHRVDDLIEVLGRAGETRLISGGTTAIVLAVALSERAVLATERIRRLVDGGLRALDTRAAELGDYWTRLARFAGLRAARRYDDAAAAGDALVAVMSNGAVLDRAGAGEAVYTGLLQVVITDVLAGRYDIARRRAARLVDDPHGGRRRHRQSLFSSVEAVDGEIALARAAIAELSADASSRWRETLRATGWHIGRAILAIEDGRSDDAEEALAELEIRRPYSEHWPVELRVRARARLVDGRAEEGLAELNRAMLRLPARAASAALASALSAAQAELAIAAGRLEEAAEILADAQPGPWVALAVARWRLAQGDAARVVRELGRIDQAAHGPRLAAELEVLMATALEQAGQPASADEAMGRALAVIDEKGLPTALRLAPRIVVDILLVRAGRAPLGARLMAPFSTPAPEEMLTAREQAVLDELATEPSASLIAERLFVSPNTVKTQLRSLYRKLGASSRQEALDRARRRGLVGRR